MQLDDLDRRLLRRLSHAPDLTNAELADAMDLAPATCARRVDRLVEAGVIKGRHAVIDWRAMGYEVEVSLRVSLDKTDPRAFDSFLAEARKIPEVLEIQTFLGRVDVRLHLIARDMAQYQMLYRSRILTLPHIAEIEALMQISTIRAAGALPL